MGADSKKIVKTDKVSKTKEKCRICGSSSLLPYLDLGQMPLPNNLFKTQEEALNCD